MVILLTIIHVLIAVFLVLAVLLQAGKGGGLAASLGGGMSSSVLGGRAASTFLSKATSILASAFLVSCLILSVVYDAPDEEPTTASERMLDETSVTPAPFTPPAGEAAGGENPSAQGQGQGAEETPAATE